MKTARSLLPSRRAMVAAWLFALLVLAAVVGIIVHFSEIEELARLLRQLRSRWLLVAAALQALTYLCAAGVWHVALARERHPVGILPLAAAALGMLFTNQAFPSAGVSGSVVMVRALRRRHVPAHIVMGALLVGLMTTYIAFLVAVLVSLVMLRVYHAVSLQLLVVTAMLVVAAVGVPAAVVWYRTSIAPRIETRLRRLPVIGRLLDAIGRAPTHLLHDHVVLRRAVALQLAEILLDAGTLQVMLIAVGARVAPTAVFGSYVIASAVSKFVPMPMGIGPFEGALVAMLHVVGVPIEAALTATLLMRGFTFWLPMLPGLRCARRELWRTGRP